MHVLSQCGHLTCLLPNSSEIRSTAVQLGQRKSIGISIVRIRETVRTFAKERALGISTGQPVTRSRVPGPVLAYGIYRNRSLFVALPARKCTPCIMHGVQNGGILMALRLRIAPVLSSERSYLAAELISSFCHSLRALGRNASL